MKRLALLDDERLSLHPVSLRLWLLSLLCLICGVVLATSYGAWMVVRHDYEAYSSTLTQVLEQRDNLMRICVARDDSMRAKVKRNVSQNIGGEESR